MELTYCEPQTMLSLPSNANHTLSLSLSLCRAAHATPETPVFLSLIGFLDLPDPS